MELQLTLEPADAKEACETSNGVMGWLERDEQANKKCPDLRGTLAQAVPGALC